VCLKGERDIKREGEQGVVPINHLPQAAQTIDGKEIYDLGG